VLTDQEVKRLGEVGASAESLLRAEDRLASVIMDRPGEAVVLRAIQHFADALLAHHNAAEKAKQAKPPERREG